MVSPICKNITYHAFKGAAAGCAVGTATGIAIASMFLFDAHIRMTSPSPHLNFDPYLTSIARAAIAQTDPMFAQDASDTGIADCVSQSNTKTKSFVLIFMASMALVGAPVVGSVVGSFTGFIRGCRQAWQ